MNRIEECDRTVESHYFRFFWTFKLASQEKKEKEENKQMCFGNKWLYACNNKTCIKKHVPRSAFNIFQILDK